MDQNIREGFYFSVQCKSFGSSGGVQCRSCPSTWVRHFGGTQIYKNKEF